MIEFQIGEEAILLETGKTHSANPDSCYHDTTLDKLSEVRALMTKGNNWKNAVEKIFAKTNPWLHSIITHPSRSKFLEEHPPNPNDLVLDIGAGWGQTALPLARTNKVCALEPTPERLEFIQAAAQQEKVEKNLYFMGADYLEVDFKTRFDLILSIGVLEWVGAFRTKREPEEIQLAFLTKTKEDLREGGRLIIGIENRIGLKYLMGARDDHIGISGIALMRKELAKKKYKQATRRELRCLTHTISEYQNMLTHAGYQQIQFFSALPDYKLPQRIFQIHENGCAINNFLLEGGWLNEHDGIDGNPLPNQEDLRSLYLSLAEMNLAHYFAPSFFIEAS